jgi:hypothetical protein
MRFTPTSCLPSIFWVACALAVAPPAVAWDPTPCDGIGSVEEYRSAAVRDLMDTNGSKPENFKPLQNVYRVCRAGQTPNDQAVFNRCLSNVRNYLFYLAAPGLGLVDNNNPPEDLSNDAYEQKYKQILKIPTCLENQRGRIQIFDDLQRTNLSDLIQVGRTVADIKQACNPLPTIVLPYVSPATDAIDEAPTNGLESDTHGRIVVWIGEPKISHYVQFTVNANSKSNMSRPQRVQASVVKLLPEGKVGAWAISTNYSVNEIVTANSNLYQATQAGRSANAGSGPSATTQAINDGTVVWKYLGASNFLGWATSTNYSVNEIVTANSNLYQATQAGRSANAGSGPSATTPPINDGTVVWKYLGATTFPKGAYIFDWKRDRSTNSFVYDKQFGNSNHCYACHLNGVIAIHPFRFVNPGDPRDIDGAGRTLGDDYRRWLGRLNSTYETQAQAMNQQIHKDSVRQEGSTELDIPTLVVNAPQPSTYVASNVSWPLPPDPLKPGGCSKAIGDLVPPTQATQWKACNVCHQHRAKPFYNVGLTDGIIAEYIMGGFMPPNITAFLDRNQVERNGGTDRQLDAASQCVITDVHRRLTQVLELPKCK